MKQCLNCYSTTTSLKGKWENWYFYKDGYICKKCCNKLIDNPKWNPITHKKWNPINNPKKIQWTPSGKPIQLKENPRKGICQQCHRKLGQGIKMTAIHHIQYHENDPLKDTIELCASCHAKKHNDMRREKK